jgi:hypothetical protein
MLLRAAILNPTPREHLLQTALLDRTRQVTRR